MYRIIGADGREYGPVSRETVAQWIAENRATAQTWIRAEEQTGWQPLGSFAEFAEALNAGRSTKPPVAAPLPIAPATHRRTNSLATASLVMGLLAVTCGCCCCYGFPFNLLGVVFGLIALTQINRAPELESGRELAIAGLVLSIASLGLSVLASMFGMLASLPGMGREMRHWRIGI
jgi:hypothetical protein